MQFSCHSYHNYIPNYSAISSVVNRLSGAVMLLIEAVVYWCFRLVS